MTGEITPETVIKSNTFIIWRGGVPQDFELKVDYRITASGNSGVNYRSVVVPDQVTPSNRFAMRGYQCDIDGQNRYTGNNYEEKGRLFLAERGEVTHVTGTRKPVVLSRVGENQELARLFTDGWNSIHLIVRGNMMIHNINGRVMSATIDDDPGRRSFKGRHRRAGSRRTADARGLPELAATAKLSAQPSTRRRLSMIRLGRLGGATS